MRIQWLALLIGTGITTSAQNWCPQGATWTYDSHGFVMLQNGYTTITYARDTVLGGFTGELILGMTVGTDFAMTDIDTMWAGTLTRHDGPVVYSWSNLQQAWDTLYNFAAVPGESWLPPFAQPGMCGGAEYGDAVQVLDTGTVVVDGMALHYLDIHNGFYDGRIVERLGFSLMMGLYEGCWVPECICDLRCYHDNEIAYVRPGLMDPCEHVASVITDVGRHEAVAPLLFPDPGGDHFTVLLSPGDHTIALCDMSGRNVLQQRALAERTLIDTSLLPSGVYAVRIDDNPTLIRWVKQ